MSPRVLELTRSDEAVIELLGDGEWHTEGEIKARTYWYHPWTSLLKIMRLRGLLYERSNSFIGQRKYRLVK